MFHLLASSECTDRMTVRIAQATREYSILPFMSVLNLHEDLRPNERGSIRRATSDKCASKSFKILIDVRIRVYESQC